MVVVPLSTNRLRVLCLIVIVLALASLALLLWPRAPHGGVSQADATRIAWENVNPGATTVASTELRKDFNTGHDLPVHQWSWVVTFNGHWQLLCQGGPQGCTPTTEWVAIDYFTGAWIASEYSYPSH
jgi:hypothetical protein